jgi:tetratricopeptide (TPR) repeat protein
MNSESSLNNLFKYYVSSGQLAFAEKIATDLLKQNFLNIEFLLTCLEMHAKKAEYDQALHILSLLAAAGYPLNACELCLQVVNFRLKKLQTTEQVLKCAQVLFASGKFSEVEQVLKQAVELEPENISVKTQLAQFYLDVGELSLAVSMVEDVFQVSEMNAKAWSIYGNALRLQGKEQDAYAAHHRALSLDAEIYESLLDVVALEVHQANNEQEYEKSILSSNRCLQVYLKNYSKLKNSDALLCKIKHDSEQAKFLLLQGLAEGDEDFIEISNQILALFSNSEAGQEVQISNLELDVIRQYNQKIFLFDQNLDFRTCLNADLNWSSIANQYKNSSPSLVVIDKIGRAHV